MSTLGIYRTHFNEAWDFEVDFLRGEGRWIGLISGLITTYTLRFDDETSIFYLVGDRIDDSLAAYVIGSKVPRRWRLDKENTLNDFVLEKWKSFNSLLSPTDEVEIIMRKMGYELS